MAMESSISSSITSSMAVEKLEGLTLKGIIPVMEEIGHGAYGRVFKVKYYNTLCAAKEIHSILVEGVTGVETRRTVEMFMRECYRCSLLRHPNIVQFLGIYRPTQEKLPVMVMEIMADSLTSLVDKHEKIPVHIKFSIVHDVSLGLCYLHNHDPPIVHRDLSPNNILLTAHHVAKISDLGVAKVIKADSKKTMTKAPGTVDFMPPEALDDSPMYGPSLDVFSFAGIVLHTFNQQWPRPSSQVPLDPQSGKRVVLSEVERRQQYVDKMRGEAEALIPLVKECLSDDPSVRPNIAYVCNIIETAKESFKKRCSTLPTTVDSMSIYNEIEQLRTEKNLLVTRNREIETQLTHRQFDIKEVERVLRMPSLSEDAPPIVSALKATRYKMKWTQLSNLPTPLSETYAAFSDHRIYVTGCTSPFEDAVHQVFVYDCPTNKWYCLPPSGHYYGIPHIIGGKLVIIGGRLTETSQRTNKVSTFDKVTHKWTSHYPDMLTVRSRPGIVTYLEYVIVAGGTIDDRNCSNDIEIFNWIENCPWTKVSTLLPFPMYAFSPIVCNEHFYIVGFSNSEMYNSREAYSIPVEKLISLFTKKSSSWNKISQCPSICPSLTPGLSTPLIIGGHTFDNEKVASQKIYMYGSNKEWKQVSKLSSPRSQSAVISINNNSIVIIGGCTYKGAAGNQVGPLATVELGQAELIYETTL